MRCHPPVPGANGDWTGSCLRRVRAGRFIISEMQAPSAMKGHKALMTKEAAARIQSAADRSGKNQDAKARVMSAAEKNSK